MNLKKIGAIFDLDGTLLKSEHILERKTCAILERYDCPPMTYGEMCRKLRVPFSDMYIDAGCPASLTDEDLYRLYREFHDHNDPVCLYPEVADVVRALHKAGTTLGIVTGNDESSLAPLRAHRIEDCFFIIETGKVDKTESIRKFCRKRGLRSHDVYYVGDMCLDMIAAAKAGVVGVGMTRDHGTRECLIESGAEEIVEDMLDFMHLIRKKHLRPVPVPDKQEEHVLEQASLL